MTGKEIVLKALNFEKTPRLPVAVLDGYLWILKKEGLSFKDLCDMEDGGASVVIPAYDDMQTDIVQPNLHACNYVFEIMGGVVQGDKKGEAFEVVKPPLQTISDIENYDVNTVWEALKNKPEFHSSIRLLELLKEHYGEEKLVTGAAAGPFTVAGMLVGVQKFMMEFCEDEEMTEKLLEFATQFVISLCAEQLEHGADSVIIAEPVASGDMISPTMFEELALPYIQKVIDALKKYNKPIMLHICGHTAARLEPLKKTGISAFSLAAVDLKEALDTAKGVYTIMGNMDPFRVLQSMTAEQVYQTCKELGEIAGLNGGYIMMPGCDLPPATPLENIQAMAKAAYDKKA